MTDDKTMTVERFDPEISCGPPCVGVMEPAAAGEYVRYADYQAALQAQDAEVAQAYAAVESKAGWEWKKRAEQAEAECARLREALREMVELRAATQAGRLTDKHELEIVRNARALLSAEGGDV